MVGTCIAKRHHVLGCIAWRCRDHSIPRQKTWGNVKVQVLAECVYQVAIIAYCQMAYSITTCHSDSIIAINRTRP